MVYVKPQKGFFCLNMVFRTTMAEAVTGKKFFNQRDASIFRWSESFDLRLIANFRREFFMIQKFFSIAAFTITGFSGDFLDLSTEQRADSDLESLAVEFLLSGLGQSQVLIKKTLPFTNNKSRSRLSATIEHRQGI
jgi:hypothetical protein